MAVKIRVKFRIRIRFLAEVKGFDLGSKIEGSQNKGFEIRTK